MLEQFADSLLQLMDATGLIGIFFATVVESFFAPIPSEIVLLTAGFYANSAGGLLLLVSIIITASLGNFVGTLPFYLVSRFSAEGVLVNLVKRFGPYLLISVDDLKKAEKFFDKHGAITVFVARLIPGIRSLVAFPAGIAKMPFLKYTFYTLLGSTIWNTFLTLVGYWAFDWKDQIFAILNPISNIILAIFLVVVIAYVLRVIYQIRKLKQLA